MRVHPESDKGMNRANSVTREKLMDIVCIWTGTAMRLSEHNLRYIRQIVKRQKTQAEKNQQMIVQTTMQPEKR